MKTTGKYKKKNGIAKGMSLPDHYDPIRLGLRSFAETEQMFWIQDGMSFEDVMTNTDELLSSIKQSKTLRSLPLMDSPTAKTVKKEITRRRKSNELIAAPVPEIPVIEPQLPRMMITQTTTSVSFVRTEEEAIEPSPPPYVATPAQ